MAGCHGDQYPRGRSFTGQKTKKKTAAKTVSDGGMRAWMKRKPKLPFKHHDPETERRLADRFMSGEQLAPEVVRRLRRKGLVTKSRKTKGLRVFKYCPKCELHKTKDGFYRNKSAADGLSGICSSCVRESSGRSYRSHREERLEKEKEQRLSARKELIAAFGGRCECCGEDNWEFLTIDHKDGGGGAHRKKAGGARGVYRELKAAGYPKDRFRLLCYNCNCARGALGYCPHEKESRP